MSAKNTILTMTMVIFLSLVVSRAQAVYLPEEGQDKPTPPSTPSGEESEALKYAPRRFIVKFKPQSAEKIRVAAPNALPAQVLLKVGDGLGELGEKYKITSIKPLFNMPSQRGGAAALSAEKHAQAIAQKFPKRAQRAPKDEPTPDLENIYLVEVGEGVDVGQAVDEFSGHPEVEYAELDHVFQIQMVPDDPYYHSAGSWGQGYDDLWGVKKISCEGAWDVSEGDGIIIAVIDTGIDYNHEDIQDNIWINLGEDLNHNGAVEQSDFDGIDNDNNGFIDDIRGWDFIDKNISAPKEDNEPLDGYGHGTHVAGTIAAVGNNNRGVIGVAPKANVMAVKGLSDEGVGYSSTLANALYYAANMGADVINCSWGGVGQSQVLKDAANYAYSLGCIVVAAAGNADGDVADFYPANIPCVIAVAAADENDSKCFFSNYGAKIDVAAPGGNGYEDTRNILSLLAEDSVFSQDYGAYFVGSKYLRLAGTSMACPHVSGLAALILSYYHDETNSEIRGRIMATTDPFPQSEFRLGSGRINAFNALNSEKKPYFKIQELSLQEQEGDGDKIPESEERINLIIKIKNFWKDANYVNADLSTDSSCISSIITTSANLGSIGRDETKDNSSNPFVFEIGSIEYDTPVEFTVTTMADAITQSINFMVELGAIVTPMHGHDIGSPKISNNKIVWHSDLEDPYYDVYVYDYELETEKRITTHPTRQWQPVISGDKVVWEDWRNGNADVYLYDLETNKEKRITTDQKNQFRPFISGNKIVWSDFRDGTCALYLYDLETNEEKRITTLPNTFPVISGGKIVWADHRADEQGTSYKGIYLYDLETNEEKRISTTQSQSPFINGNKIVWIDFRSGQGSIYLYDLEKEEEKIIAARGSCPTIFGDNIVWLDWRSNESSVYLYNLKTEEEKRVSNYPGYQYVPFAYDNKIIWVDFRNGKDIYMTEIIDHAPELGAIGNKEVAEVETLSFSITATDVDGDALTYSASNLPSGASFSGPTFIWAPTYDQAGTYHITFSVTDGKKTDSETIAITVNNVNRAPLVDSQSIATDEDKPITITLTATDPDGDSLTYTIVTLPSHGALLEGQTVDLRHTATSYLDFIYTPAANYNGGDSFSFKVNDGIVDSSTVVVAISINPINDVPVFDVIGNRVVDEGQTLSFTVLAQDIDGDSLTYTASNLPQGAAFMGQTFSWTPGYDQSGSYKVVFNVADPGGLSDSERINIRVNDVPQPSDLQVDLSAWTMNIYGWVKFTWVVKPSNTVLESATLTIDGSQQYNVLGKTLRWLHFSVGTKHTAVICIKDTLGNISSDSVTFTAGRHSRLSLSGRGLSLDR